MDSRFPPSVRPFFLLLACFLAAFVGTVTGQLTSNDAFIDRDGNILLLNRNQQTLSRWSPDIRGFTDTFTLSGTPTFGAYSAENHCFYVAYASNTVQAIDLGAATPSEIPLFTLPSSPNGLATAGEFIFACDPTGWQDTHYVYSREGSLLHATTDWRPYSRVWEWDPVTRRMYHFGDDSSFKDLVYDTIDTNGTITGAGGPNSHDFSITLTPPIRVSPDGTRIVIGSGVVFEPDALTKTAYLANGFSDAIWAGGGLITLREDNGNTQLQTWEGGQLVQGEIVRQFPGTPVRLFETNGGLLVITSTEGHVRFTLLDGSFEPFYVSPTPPTAPADLIVTGRSDVSVSLHWSDLSDNENGFRIEYLETGGSWTNLTTVSAGVTTTTATGLTPGTTYEFRITATNGALESTPSTSATARTLSSPDEPVGEPYLLAVSRIFSNSITIEWQDNANNETGFRILQSTSSGGPFTTFTVPAGTTSFASSGLVSRVTYYFKVQAVNGDTDGELSGQVSARTLSSNTTPARFRTLTVQGVTPTSVTLEWTDPATNEDGFIIERAPSGTSNWTQVGTTSYNIETFTDTTATPNTSYSYRVAAYNELGNSYSRTVNATTPSVGGLFTGLASRSGDVYYFAFSEPDRIERYDLEARAWQPPVPLNATATALWVDTDVGILVAEGRTLVRFDVDGSRRTLLANALSDIRSLFTSNQSIAFAPLDGDFMILDKLNGTLLSSFSYTRSSGTDFSTAPSLNRIFFNSVNRNPSDIYFFDFDNDGNFITGDDSPYHGDYPAGERSFVFPDESRVADTSGTVYTTNSLTYSGTMGGGFTDLDFHGPETPILLRDNRLVSLTSNLLESASFTLPGEGLRVAVNNDDALVFSTDGLSPNGLLVEIIPLSSLTPPDPGPQVDPNGLPYTVDEAFADRDGNILLFSKGQRSLFRWSPAERRYSGSFPLLEEPAFAAYSKENHSAYFAYASQMVRAMDLGRTEPAEVPLFAFPTAPTGLACAGHFIFGCDLSGSWYTHHVFSPSGERTDAVDWNHNSPEWEWDPANRRMYFYYLTSSGSTLRYESIDGNGTIAASGGSPFMGPLNSTPPIRVSEDGSRVAIGTGEVFDAEGLSLATSLANGWTDAIWSGGTLLSIREINGITQLQTWEGEGFLRGDTVRQFTGKPVRLFETAHGLLVITSINGTPQFTLLDQALNPIYLSPRKPVSPSGLVVTGRGNDFVSLQWTDRSNNEDGFRVEFRNESGPWTAISAAGPNTSNATAAGLAADTTYEFRVIATNGTLESTPSPSTTARTLSSPDEPVGEPYHLTVSRIFSDSITIDWQDNADNETGFRIVRSTSPDGPFTVLTVPADSTSFTSDGLSPATSYYFQVQAVNGGIGGELSAQVHGKTLASDSAPYLSYSLNVVSTSPTSVTLGWLDASTNENGFIVERQVYGTSDWNLLGTTSYNVVSFTDATAEPDTAYYYRVAAFNGSGSSAYRSVYAVTPPVGGEFTGLAMRSGDVHYFAFTGPDRVERFDLAARAWLPPLPLEATATALWVDAEAGTFVAEGRTLVRFDPDGTHRTVLADGGADIKSLFTQGHVLAFSPNRDFVTMDKSAGIFLSNYSFTYSGTGYSAAPHLNRVFFRSTSVSPGDIFYFEFDDNGNFLSGTDSPYHAAYPSATRTIVFPDGRRVADTSGTVYSTESLTYTNSLGGSFTDLDFHGTDIPIVLRDNRLTCYTNSLVEKSNHILSGEGLRVAVSGDDAVVFLADSYAPSGLTVETVPLSVLDVPNPDQPVDPNGLAYSVNDTFVDRDGNILTFSKDQLSLFRWSPSERHYTGSFPLQGVPDFAAYSSENHSAYFAYASRTIRAMVLDSPEPVETPLFTLPGRPTGLSTAGSFIFSSDPTSSFGYIGTHYLHSSTGEMTDSVVGHHNSPESVWDPVKRRMYFFANAVPSNVFFDTIDSNGKFTGNGKTPYNGGVTPTPPIRIYSDGSPIIVGSGALFAANGLNEIMRIAPFKDALWRQNDLLTINEVSGHTLLSKLPIPSLQVQSTFEFPGTPVRLLSLPDGTVALLAKESGVLRIHLLNSALQRTFYFASSPIATKGTPYTWEPGFEWPGLESSGLQLTAPELPGWLSFSSGVLAGTPGESDVGTNDDPIRSHRVVIQATDLNGMSQQREFYVTALWTNTPPILTPSFPELVADASGADIHFDLTPYLFDPDNGDTHTWSISLPDNPSILSDLSLDENGLSVRFA